VDRAIGSATKKGTKKGLGLVPDKTLLETLNSVKNDLWKSERKKGASRESEGGERGGREKATDQGRNTGNRKKNSICT